MSQTVRQHVRQHTRHVAGRAGHAEALAAEQVTLLPAREELSLVNANLALPINAALSANVLSDGAVAASNAQQTTPINQGMLSGLPSL